MNPTLKNKIAIILLAIYSSSTFISMASMSIGSFCLILCAALLSDKETWKQHLKSIIISRYLLLTSIMISILLISVTIQFFKPFSVFGNTPTVQYFAENKKFIYLFNPILLSYTLLKLFNRSPSRVIGFHWIALAGAAVFGLQQFFTGKPFSVPTTEIIPGVQTHLTTLFLGLTHSVTSNFSIASFPLFAALLLQPKVFTEYFRKPLLQSPKFWATISILALFVIFMVFARSAWITTPIGIGLLLLMGLERKKAIRALIVLIGAGILITSLPATRERLQSKLGYEDRIALWKGNFELFKEHPLLGVGWRQSSKLVGGAVTHHYTKTNTPIPAGYFQSHAHNTYIEILSSTGIIGLAMFIYWCFFVCKTAYQNRLNPKYNWWMKGFLAGMAVIFLNGMIQVNFWDSKVLHQIMFQFGVMLSISSMPINGDLKSS